SFRDGAGLTHNNVMFRQVNGFIINLALALSTKTSVRARPILDSLEQDLLKSSEGFEPHIAGDLLCELSDLVDSQTSAPTLSAKEGKIFAPFHWLDKASLRKIFDLDFHSLPPVSIHLAPCLICNYQCPGCMFGAGKMALRQNPHAHKVITMSLESMKAYIDKIKASGAKEVVFTGGGEPLLNPHTIDAMRYAKSVGLDVVLYTNGSTLTPSTIKQILDIEPRFVRISLNANDPEIYRLFHGLENASSLDTVKDNINLLCQEKLYRINHFLPGKDTEVSLAVLLSPLNIGDISGIAKYAASLSSISGPDRLVLRPMNNFPGTKQDSPIAREGIKWVREHQPAWAADYEAFLEKGEQFSLPFWEAAKKEIEEQAVPILANTDVTVNYPAHRMLSAGRPRPYPECLACGYASFLAPGGGVYDCVERSGDHASYIGSLDGSSTLLELYGGDTRNNMLEALHAGGCLRCPPGACMNHEHNVIYNNLKKFSIEYPELWQELKTLLRKMSILDPSAESTDKIIRTAGDIHVKNRDFAPKLSDKKLVVYLVDGNLIPPEQLNMFEQIQQEMRLARGTQYQEKFVLVKDSFAVSIAETKELYEKDGYKVDFVGACSDITAVRSLNFPALAFKKTGSNFVQPEAFMLALRALSSGNIESLKNAYAFLSGEKLPDDIARMHDIMAFASRFEFPLPSATAEIKELPKINAIIKKMILEAA
ncbi:MAG: radical SAM protein, partial [Candidatus Omnitrophica bacterium]|nr:radical SAM protein [Candidatus Omnitrophota bacterium]